MDIGTTIKVAKEIVNTVEKIHDLLDKAKNVAESEGEEQIVATKELSGAVADKKQNIKSLEGQSSNKELKIEGDLSHGEKTESTLDKDVFVDELEPAGADVHQNPDMDEFVEEIPQRDSTTEIDNEQNPFVDRLPPDDSGDSVEVIGGHTIDTPSSDKIKEWIDNNAFYHTEASDAAVEKKPEGLTAEDKKEIKEQTGWSDKIVNAIRTKEEAKIYIDAGLVEGEVNGKPALLQPNIDGDACNEPKWSDWSNRDLAEEGYPPRDKDGYPYELHHIGQNPDSPLAELTYDQHHSDGNFKVLHTFDESSVDRVKFNNERKEYWSARFNTL